MKKFTWESRLIWLLIWIGFSVLMALEANCWLALLDGFIAGTYFQEMIYCLEKEK